MQKEKATLSFIGIGIGSVALLLAIVHFWAGSFNHKPSMEKTFTEKAIAFKDKAKAAMKGEELKAPAKLKSYDLDKIFIIVIALLGGLAVVFGFIGFAKKEPLRVAGTAALLGSIAISFQFIIIGIAIAVTIVVVLSLIANFAA